MENAEQLDYAGLAERHILKVSINTLFNYWKTQNLHTFIYLKFQLYMKSNTEDLFCIHSDIEKMQNIWIHWKNAEILNTLKNAEKLDYVGLVYFHLLKVSIKNNTQLVISNNKDLFCIDLQMTLENADKIIRFLFYNILVIPYI